MQFLAPLASVANATVLNIVVRSELQMLQDNGSFSSPWGVLHYCVLKAVITVFITTTLQFETL